MKKDIRDTPLYAEAEALHATLRRPGTGQISDIAEVHVSPGAQHAVFAGVLMDKLEGAPPTRICRVDLSSGTTQVLSFGPNTDRLPKYSPDGGQIAFLSDRHQAGDFQLYLMDSVSGAVRATPAVSGWVEYLHWSPDGRRVLLGVAGHGADVAGGQGAASTKPSTVKALPSWMPEVDCGDESYHWRRLWIYDVHTDRVQQVSSENSNIWEAVWCGAEAVAAVMSDGPKEGLWYTARLHILEVATGDKRELYAPADQIGWPAASPSGKHLAIVEAICSDRWLVAGNLRLIEVLSGEARWVSTNKVDITYTEWRSDDRLLLAGHRGPETVIGLYDLKSDEFTEVWSSAEITTGSRYVTVAGLNETGDCALAGEGFVRAPEIAVIRKGQYKTLKSFDLGYTAQISVGAVEQCHWQAPDGLRIEGWLLRPQGNAPHPLVMHVHGGPVSHSRPVWLGRRLTPLMMLLNRGYAIFFPNPRGSAGRGQEFARHVVGEMGGADTHDLLSGLDHLVARGLADPARLGVSGASYGGYMTSWLITQDRRFAAAVSISPVTNHVTEHLISNIPQFVSIFLADTYTNPGGKYFARSPVMHAHKARTPTLNVCGALDRCTPPEEAVQFHNALLENAVRSALAIYPQEGHGVRKFPAAIDYAARFVAWFEEHMPVDVQS